MIEYENLEKFLCERNDLEFLPGDLFENFKQLNWIDFYGNQLKVIELNILDSLDGIVHVIFSSNPNYDKCYSIYPIYNPNSTLEDVKCQIFEKFFTSNPQKIQKFLDKFDNPMDMLKIYDSRVKNVVAKSNILDIKFRLLEEKLEKLSQELENEKIKKIDMAKNFQEQIDYLALKVQSGLFVDFKTFILNESTKDFRIQIADRDFQVHKFLLAARSPTLAEFLKNNPDAEHFKLLDVPVEIFEVILKFLYTDELPGGDGIDFLDLFSAAAKLKIQELTNYAATKLLDQITNQNALNVLHEAEKYGHNELSQAAFNKIRSNYPRMEFKDKWMKQPEKLQKFIDVIHKKADAMKEIETVFHHLNKK
ncbi:rabankyrin-5-like isoform X2 [Chironomus tepperi]